jgi:hypothetical protein
MSERQSKPRRYGHWFRVYDEILDDPKIVGLPENICWTWIKVLAVARRYGGVLPASAELAIVLRLNERETKKRIDILIKAGLLDGIDGPDGPALTPHGWQTRQFDSDVSTSRVRAFRERNRNLDETLNETFHSPFQERSCNDNVASAKLVGNGSASVFCNSVVCNPSDRVESTQVGEQSPVRMRGRS